MEARNELAQQIVVLIAGNAPSDYALQQQIMAILEDYSIQRKQEPTPADLGTHVQHFLGAISGKVPDSP